MTITLLVASCSLGPKKATVAAHNLNSEELAGAFDSAFLFCTILQVAALLLMGMVKDTYREEAGGNEPAI